MKRLAELIEKEANGIATDQPAPVDDASLRAADENSTADEAPPQNSTEVEEADRSDQGMSDPSASSA